MDVRIGRANLKRAFDRNTARRIGISSAEQAGTRRGLEDQLSVST